MRSMFDAINGVDILSSPYILNEPALQLPSSAGSEMSDAEAKAVLEKHAVKYVEGAYHVADSGPFALSAAGVNYAPLPLLVPVTFSMQPTCPMKVKFFGFPSTQAPGVFFQSIKIGPVDLIEGAEIPAEAFSEVSNLGTESWPTLPVAQPFIVVCINRGAIVRYGQPFGRYVRVRR